MSLADPRPTNALMLCSIEIHHLQLAVPLRRR
jgi:hypothetical protein